MGTITIEWDNVRSVTSAVLYEVEVGSGLLSYGTLRTPTSRMFEVVNSQSTARLNFDDIVRFAPVGTRFWRRLDGSIDSGFTFNQSLHQTQLSLNTMVTHRRPGALMQVSFSSALTTQENAARQTKNDMTVSSQRTFRPRWNTVIFGQGQQNEQLALNFRTVLGGGISRTLLQS